MNDGSLTAWTGVAATPLYCQQIVYLSTTGQPTCKALYPDLFDMPTFTCWGKSRASHVNVHIDWQRVVAIATTTRLYATSQRSSAS